jgi:hypothetical protein
MPTGVNCKAASLKGKPYCYAHARLHHLKTASPIRAMKNLRLPALIDHNAIQVAHALVTDALGSGRIDTECATLALYGIQIGAQNIAPRAIAGPTIKAKTGRVKLTTYNRQLTTDN